MKFMLVSLIVIYSLVLSGCISKVENIFTDTKKASPDDLSLGNINRNAPIIKDPEAEKEKKIQERVKSKIQKSNKLQREYEMVGYIVSVYEEPDIRGLYLYTFTDALRVEKIQFYAKKRLPYSKDQLIRVSIKDNFLVKAQIYKSVTGRRSKSYIDAAKEYLIKF